VVEDWGVLGGLRHGRAGQIEGKALTGRKIHRYRCLVLRAGWAPEDSIATPPARHVEGGSVSEELTGMMVAMLGSNWSPSE